MAKLKQPLKFPELKKIDEVDKTVFMQNNLGWLSPKVKLLRNELLEHIRAGRPAIPMTVLVSQEDDNKATKKPSIPSWREYQRRCPTIEEAENWFKQPLLKINAIALVTGRISGLWVLDGDSPEALDWMRNYALETPIKARTLNGEHWYYKTPEEGYIKNDTNVLKNDPPNIDTRGEGGLIIVPPSDRHPKRNIRYEWIGLLKPSPDDWASVPVWEGPEGVLSANYQQKIASESSVPEDRDGDSLFSKGERNSTLTSRVGVWIGQRYKKTIVTEAANVWNKIHCSPPLEDKEVNAIVDSIWRKHYTQHSKANVEVERVFMSAPPKGLDDASEYGEIPELILNPGGLLQMFMDYVETSSVLHVPMFALGAGIGLIGTLVGGKVANETGLKTNFYVITLAPSGDGKNAQIAAIKRILSSDPKLKKLLGPTTLASDAALFSNLVCNPVQIMLFDELGDFMSVVHRKQGSAVSGVPKALKELFSCPDDEFCKHFADTNKNFKIIWHNLSFYGTGVPDSFWNSITLQDIADGFLSRNLILQYQSTHIMEKRKTTNRKPPDNLMESILKLQKIPYKSSVIPINQKLPEAYIIKKSPEAAAMANEFENKYRELAFKCRDDPDKIEILYNRAIEHVEKIAMIHLISRKLEVMEYVDSIDMEYAITFVDYIVPKLVIAAKKYVGYNPQDKLRRDILSLVTKKGHITIRDVYRKIKDCDSRQAEDALKILINQGYLEKGAYHGHMQYRRIAKPEQSAD
jgi:hypothetical protein